MSHDIDFNRLKELLKANRTYRRFDATHAVGHDTLVQLVELVRFCASGRNAQPLRYRLVSNPDACDRLFPALAWAGYYTDWAGPLPSERPTAYLVQCLDRTLGENCLCDDGLQLEAITLGATTLGLGCCIIKAFNPQKVTAALGLPANMVPRYVVAIGRPAETVMLEDMKTPEASFRYYRDASGVHHVPKRPLSELIISSESATD